MDGRGAGGQEPPDGGAYLLARRPVLPGPAVRPRVGSTARGDRGLGCGCVSWPAMSEPLQKHTRIKICGLTREEDVDAAVEAGADAVGFVLYSNSPRFVPVERAAELASRLPPFVTPVLLFV